MTGGAATGTTGGAVIGTTGAQAVCPVIDPVRLAFGIEACRFTSPELGNACRRRDGALEALCSSKVFKCSCRNFSECAENASEAAPSAPRFGHTRNLLIVLFSRLVRAAGAAGPGFRLLVHGGNLLLLLGDLVERLPYPLALV